MVARSGSRQGKNFGYLLLFNSSTEKIIEVTARVDNYNLIQN